MGRRWAARPLPRWRKLRIGKIRAGDAAEAVLSAPDIGGADEIALSILVPLALVDMAFVVIPLLLFGVELVLLGLIIAVGIVGRALLGRPWIVEATSPPDSTTRMSWRVAGWRRSTRLIEEVCTSLSAGVDPSPAEALDLIPAGRV